MVSILCAPLCLTSCTSVVKSGSIQIFLTTEGHRGKAQRDTEVFEDGLLHRVHVTFIDAKARLILVVVCVVG